MQSLMLTSPLSHSFLNTNSLSTSSFDNMALRILINFLVLWFICLSSYLLYFKNGSEHFTSVSAQVIISLIRILLQSLASSIV